MGFFDHYYQGEVSDIGFLIEKAENRLLFSRISSLIKDNNQVRLLEIGVGKGHFAGICQENGFHYTGIEANKNQAVKLTVDGHKTLCAYVPPLPVKDNRFDIIYGANVLEHMNDCRMAQELIGEIFDKLVDGGYAAIACPDYLDWKGDFFNCDYTHNYPTTVRRVSQLMENSGFKTVDTLWYSGGCAGKKGLIVKYLNKLYPWKIFDLFLGKYFHESFFYKAKLTFSERFLVIGKKVGT